MLDEGKIVTAGSPSEIIEETFPDYPEAGLNDVFIRLMSRGTIEPGKD
jgi:hypothetical protein